MNFTALKMKEHPIFRIFWNDMIPADISGKIQLSFVPHEYISYYQKTYNYEMNLISEDERYSRLKACVTVLLTSMESEIDIDDAINNIDAGNTNKAVRIHVKVFDNKQSVFSTEFNLGSMEAEKILTNSIYYNLFSVLYQ